MRSVVVTEGDDCSLRYEPDPVGRLSLIYGFIYIYIYVGFRVLYYVLESRNQ